MLRYVHGRHGRYKIPNCSNNSCPSTTLPTEQQQQRTSTAGTTLMQQQLPPRRRTSNSAIVSMVLGIFSIPLFLVGIIPGTMAIVFGIRAMRQIEDKPQEITGQCMANTGVICGTIEISMQVLVISFNTWVYVNNRVDYWP
jgi:Domain of unknown function (DUF4190)